jgi:hypothetical protein
VITIKTDGIGGALLTPITGIPLTLCDDETNVESIESDEMVGIVTTTTGTAATVI